MNHEPAQAVLAGRQWSTWRLFDDKDLAVNDTVELVDKVDQSKPQTWKIIGTAHINRIIEKRLGDISDQDYESADQITSPAERLTLYRSFYGDDVTLATPVKMVYFDFMPAGSAEPSAQPIKRVENIIVYADGGSRGNPGPSASGYVLMDEQENVLVDKGVYLGITTNNQAEYQALKFALEEARRMGAKDVSVRLDSMLVVNQMNGVFKVSNRDLWPVHDSIKKIIISFDHISFTHVPRELNTLADAAVNRVLDEAAAHGRGQ